MKMCLFTIAVLFLIPFSNTQHHVMQKRFLWKSLAQLTQPFMQKPQPPSPPQAYPQPHYNNYPTRPVYQVSPTVPQPIRLPPSSGQLYLPIPGNNYPQNTQPVYVPPSSFGSQSGYPQMPPGQIPLKPLATQSEGGPLFYGGASAPVEQSSVSLQTQGGVSDVSLTNESQLSGVDAGTLVTEPFLGTSVFLASSDRVIPSGFVKIPLPTTVLESVVGLGIETPTIYLASTSTAPSQDFALLEINNDTIEALRDVAQQPDSSHAAELPSTVSKDLVMAIKSSAPQLVENSTTIELDDVLSDEGLAFTDLTDTSDIFSEPGKNAETDTSLIEQDFTELEISPKELKTVYLAQKKADIPADYIRVLLPDDILRELRRRVPVKTLNAQKLQRYDLAEAYMAPRTSNAVRSPTGLVPVPLSDEALEVLNDYANEAERTDNSNNDSPQLELPRSVLESLSKDSSQRVWLINGEKDTIVKSGSNDVFIAPRNKKPPNGYVGIPLSENIMSDLKKNFLGSSIRSQNKGIPVRAYIAPADKKLPPGHVAVPLPDSVLDSVQLSDISDWSTTQEAAGSRRNEIILTKNTPLFAESDSAVYLAPSRKMAPLSFRKLKLPETIMEDLRHAIPATKLAESGNLAKDLTAAYLASSNEYIPPGFLSISVPHTLVKMLDAFSETRDDIESDNSEETSKSSTKSKGRAVGSSRTAGAEGSNISRKIINALLEATGRTVSQVFKNSRGDNRNNNNRNRGRESSRGNRRNRKGNRNNPRDNARATGDNADENEFDENVEESMDSFQSHMPFIPPSVSDYPYIDPYQYGGHWPYGDANEWSAENQDVLYHDENGSPIDGLQYEFGHPQYQVSNLKKRHGEIQKETSPS